MIARPKISRNERKTTERGAFEVGNFAPFSCPGDDGSCDAAVKRDTAVTVARILRGGVRLSRDATLNEFQAYLETLQRHGRGAGDGRDVLRTSTRDALARRRSCAELDVLRPVRIVELERGRIASGRVLRCATITDAAKSTATIAVVDRGAGFNFASTCAVRARARSKKTSRLRDRSER